MKCYYCAWGETTVSDSRMNSPLRHSNLLNEVGYEARNQLMGGIRRRRKCNTCKKKYTTIELTIDQIKNLEDSIRKQSGTWQCRKCGKKVNISCPCEEPIVDTSR